MANSDPHLDDLLKRPPAERAKAAQQLLESLDDDAPPGDITAAQAEEIARRLRALDAGAAVLLDPDEVRRRVRARLASLRRSG